MISGKDVTYLGYIAKPHGYQGKIKIKPLQDVFHEHIPEWLFFCIDSKPVPFKVESFLWQPDEWIVKVEFLENEESVREYQNVRVGILIGSDGATPIPQDIIGFKLFDSTNNTIGVVTAWIDRPEQPLMEVERDGKKSVLIPLVEDWILDWNDLDKTIQLTIPEGLLDL